MKKFVLLSVLSGSLLVACHGMHMSGQPMAQGEQMNAERLMEDIRELASDAYGGRAPMSEGGMKTLDYLESAFRRIGLAPMFGDSYRQPVDLVSITAQPANLHVDAGDTHKEYRYADDVVVGTRRPQENVQLQDSELVFVGYGINAPEYGWNDYEGLDVSGKTVLILVNDPGFATRDEQVFRGHAMTYYGRWTYKYDEAARQGAAAAFIIHETAPAAYPWAVVRSSWVGPQFHLSQPEAGAAEPVLVEGWMQHHVAEEMLRLAGHDLRELEARAASGAMHQVTDIEVSVQFANTLVHDRSWNIGALIPGAVHADELFVYMAHWDHLGTVAPVDPSSSDEDIIYNGAVDNASGTAALLELARAFTSGEAPQRSVGFLAVTAEESGLLGSAAYARDPAFPMNKTVAGINMDGLNVIGPMNDIIVVGHNSSELEDWLKKAAAQQGRVPVPEDEPEKGYYYRSDHFSFAKRGVPVLYAEGGSEHRELGSDYVRQKKAEYIEKHYHKPSDEIRGDWDMRGAMEDLEIYHTIGQGIANSRDWPKWYPGNEFKAIREQSMQSSM